MTRTKPTTSLRSSVLPVPGWLLLVLLVSVSLLFNSPATASSSSLAQRKSNMIDGATTSDQDERELNKENSTVFDEMNATMTAASSQGSPEGNTTMSMEHQSTPLSGSSKGGGGGKGYGKGGGVKGDSSTSSSKTGGTGLPGGAAKVGKGKGGKGGDSSSSSKIGYGSITTGAPLASSAPNGPYYSKKSAPTASIAPNSPYYSKKSGSKDSKKGASKDSKKGGSKDSSSKKDIKGASSKTDKSLKGKGKGKGGSSSTMVPTSSGELTMVPDVSPTPVAPNATTAPVPAPAPVLPPSADDITVALSPYFLFYEIEQTRIPNLDDYSQLGLFTSEYLDVYFRVVFADTFNVSYVSSTTEVTGSEFRLGQPTRVDYSSTMSFAADSEMIPELADLDALLRSAFEGGNAATYVTAVANGLDASNIFSTTTSISFEVAAPPAGGTERRVAAGIVIGSAAAAFVLLLAGVAAYRNHQKEENHEKLLEHLEQHDDGGDTITDDRTLETQERTYHSSHGQDNENDDGDASRWGYKFGPSRHRLHTVPPPVFMVEEDESGGTARVVAEQQRQETPAERRKRLERVAF